MIETQAEVKMAQLKSEAKKEEILAKIRRDEELNRVEAEYKKNISELKILKQGKLADLEANKFEEMMSVLGKQTLIEIANVNFFLFF